MSDQIAIARAVAHIAHRGQVDKAGKPYITHPERVAKSFGNRVDGDREILTSIAWLHDVLEDSDLTRDDLLNAGVEAGIVSAVERLTRTASVAPEEYYEDIMDSWHARQVKLADIADNCDPNRLVLLDDATVVRLTRKYAKARQLLGAAPKDEVTDD